MKKNDDDLTPATEGYRAYGHDGKYKPFKENSNKSYPRPKGFPESDKKDTLLSRLLNRKSKNK